MIVEFPSKNNIAALFLAPSTGYVWVTAFLAPPPPPPASSGQLYGKRHTHRGLIVSS